MKLSQAILRFSIPMLLTMDVSAAGLVLQKVNLVDPYSANPTGESTHVFADYQGRARDALMSAQYGNPAISGKILYAAPLFHAYNGANDIAIPTFFSLRPTEVTLPESVKYALGGRAPDDVFFMVTVVNVRPIELGVHGGLLEARPHTWLDPTAPYAPPHPDKNIPFTMEILEPSSPALTFKGLLPHEPDTNTIHSVAIIHLSGDPADPATYVLSSPDNFVLKGYPFATDTDLEKLDLSFYSVTTGERDLPTGKVVQTAVTLHCIVGPNQRAEVERLNAGTSTVGEWGEQAIMHKGTHHCVQKLRELMNVAAPAAAGAGAGGASAHAWAGAPAIDFTTGSALPSFVVADEGLSGQEPHGRWSDASLKRSDGSLSRDVVITMDKPLPATFRLILEGIAFGDNVGQKMPIHIGSRIYPITLRANFTEAVMVELGDEVVKKITFTPPNPQQPGNGDPRHLAVGFKKLSIEPI